MHRLLIILLTSFIFLVPTSHAKMYKWVDKDGVTQFSTFPPDNIDDDYQTLSSNKSLNLPVAKYIIGNWIYHKNNKKFKIIISNNRINFYEFLNNSQSVALRSKASWSLSGKILSLRYSKLRKVKLKLKREKLIIAKINDNELVLINNNTNKKIRAKRNNYQQESLIKKSPLIQKIIGYWNGITDRHNIKFNKNGTFSITGLLKRRSTVVYKGTWEYSDPKLIFNFEIDKLIPNGRMSKIGKAEIYSVKKLADDSLVIRSHKTGKIKKYLRKKKRTQR